MTYSQYRGTNPPEHEETPGCELCDNEAVYHSLVHDTDLCDQCNDICRYFTKEKVRRIASERADRINEAENKRLKAVKKKRLKSV